MRLFATLLLVPLLTAPVVASSPDPLEECRALVRDHPDDSESYDCFFAAARRHGLWDEAARLLEAQLALDSGNHLARFYLAGVEEGRGSQRAEQLYRESVDGFAESGGVEDEIHARLLLSLYLRRRGRLQEAGDILRLASKLVDEGNLDGTLVAKVRLSEAWQAMTMGDHGKALAPMLEAERLAFPDGPVQLQTDLLSGMGRAYWGMGNFRKGLETYAREAALREEIGDLYGSAAPRYNIALLAGRLFSAGEMDKRDYLELIEQALAVAIKVGHQPLEARNRMLLGQNVDDVEDASSHFKRAIELSHRLGDRLGVRQARRLLAQLVWRSEPDRRHEALELVDEAITDAHSLGDLQEKARGIAVRAWMLWDTGDRSEGMEEYLRLLDAVEKIRDLQPDGSVRAGIFSQWTFPYYRFSGGLLAGLEDSTDPDGDLEIAFHTMERMRARVLLDELESAGARALLNETEPAYLQRAGLLESISELQKMLSDPALPAGRRAESLERLEQLEEMEIVLRDDLARAQPEYAKLRRPAFPTLVEIQQGLSENQALLLYQIAQGESDHVRAVHGGGSWLLSVARNEVRYYALPDRKMVEHRIGAFVGLLQRRDGSEIRAAERLFEELLGKAVSDLGPAIDRLVIVPDRDLHRLPFGALRGRDGDPLALHYGISYAPSATVWLRWVKQATVPVPVRGLAFADPELSFASEGSEERSGDPWLSGLRLKPLPYARKEAQTMVRSIGNNSRLLQSAEASEWALKQADLSEFGLLYFAAHAVVDSLKPERSAILLAPGSSAEDGMLQIREIVDLDLDGCMVVLTACHSASGVVMEGEGVVGLARAFFVAGARAVIGGLWSLKDDEAALLMADFSRELARGRSLSDALSAARAARVRAGEPPAAWAGIVLLGDGEYVPLPGGRGLPAWLFWIVGALLFGLAGWVYLALRARRSPLFG